MNAPHHKASGQLFRSIVEARPGHTLLSFDYKGFHALYLAWLSGDKVMERVCRFDMPSFATAHFLKLPHSQEALDWPDDQLRDWLARVKTDYRHVRDAKMKHALHGYDNGMQPYGCYMRFREYFDSRREVERAMAVLDSLFHVALTYRRNQVEIAHSQGYLINQFGRIRYFFEAKRWCGGDWSHGDDTEAAISFQQQSSAHCHLADVMLRLDPTGWLDRAGFCTPIHDDLTFECPLPVRDEAVAYIRQEMEAPSPITGLSVAVEAKAGPRWSEMTVLP
jgi:DNA polymerase I-like protein with 3'-5' exonuclease and polymerase domains